MRRCCGKLWSGGLPYGEPAVPGYDIPIMCVFGPSLRVFGSWSDVALATMSACIGVTLLAAGLHGYLLRPAWWWGRLILVAAALVLIDPGLTTDLIGDRKSVV